MQAVPFPDPTSKPDEAALAKCLGTAYGPIASALLQLQKGRPSIVMSWKFSKTSGWYLTYDRGKKRLCYLFPKHGDFLLKLVFNEKGVQTLRGTDLPPDIRAKLSEAKKYSEGTLLEFSAAEITKGTLTQLLSVKVGSIA